MFFQRKFNSIIVTLLFVCLCAFPININAATVETDPELTRILTIPIERDAYGKFVVDGDALEKVADHVAKFTQFIERVQECHPLKPIIISLSVKNPHPALFAAMEPFQFDMYHVDNTAKKVEYIFRNGRAVPEPDTSSIGTNVVLYNVVKGEVFLTKDHDKPFLTCAGGYTNRDETAETAAIRECKEEINLTIDPSRLKLAGVRHAINRGERQPVSLTVFLYYYPITDADVAAVRLDPKEVAWAKSVKLSAIDMETGEVATPNGFLMADGSEGADKAAAIKIHGQFLPVLKKILAEGEFKAETTHMPNDAIMYLF